jgi:hypothetical protein
MSIISVTMDWLKHQSITANAENLRHVLGELDNPTLINLWFHLSETFQFTKSWFASVMSVNRANFVRWIADPEKHFVKQDASKRAIKDFILLGDNPKPIPSNNEHRTFLLRNVPKILICMDIENKGCRDLFYSLYSMLRRSTNVGIHILAAYNATNNEYDGDYDHKLVTMLKAQTSAKDSADHTLSMEIAILDFLLPKEIPFILVSGDGFVREICAKLKVQNRNSVVIFDSEEFFSILNTDYSIYFDTICFTEELRAFLEPLKKALIYQKILVLKDIENFFPLNSHQREKWGSWTQLLTEFEIKKEIGVKVYMHSTLGWYVIKKT